MQITLDLRLGWLYRLRERLGLFYRRLSGTSHIFLLVGTLAGAAAGPNQGTAADIARILSLENAWNGAEVNRDMRSLDLLIPATFVYTESDGSFMNKSQWMAQIRVNQYQRMANTGVSVQVYEDAAVVTGEYREKLQVKGKMVVRSGRFTDTWIRRDGDWKCLASQSTLVGAKANGP